MSGPKPVEKKMGDRTGMSQIDQEYEDRFYKKVEFCFIKKNKMKGNISLFS